LQTGCASDLVQPGSLTVIAPVTALGAMDVKHAGRDVTVTSSGQWPQAVQATVARQSDSRSTREEKESCAVKAVRSHIRDDLESIAERQ
jgi:hypothetical protein